MEPLRWGNWNGWNGYEKFPERTISTIAPSEVPTLDHEAFDNSVKLAALVPLTLRPGGELLEVLYSFRNNVAEQADLQSASIFSSDTDVEPDHRSYVRSFFSLATPKHLPKLGPKIKSMMSYYFKLHKSNSMILMKTRLKNREQEAKPHKKELADHRLNELDNLARSPKVPYSEKNRMNIKVNLWVFDDLDTIVTLAMKN